MVAIIVQLFAAFVIVRMLWSAFKFLLHLALLIALALFIWHSTPHMKCEKLDSTTNVCRPQ